MQEHGVCTNKYYTNRHSKEPLTKFKTGTRTLRDVTQRKLLVSIGRNDHQILLCDSNNGSDCQDLRFGVLVVVEAAHSSDRITGLGGGRWRSSSSTDARVPADTSRGGIHF